MTSKILRFLLALVVCVTLAPGAYAKGGHGNGHGGDKQDKHHDDDRDHHHADRDHHHDGDHDRDDKRPAGWDKGKKTGWGGCDVPPGQAKKEGCHPNSTHHTAHHDRDRVSDRDHDRDHVRDRDHDRDHHTTTVKRTTTTTTTGGQKTTTTTTKVPAQTREQARRTGGKVYNDDGSWHYGSGQTTATKK